MGTAAARSLPVPYPAMAAANFGFFTGFSCNKVSMIDGLCFSRFPVHGFAFVLASSNRLCRLVDFLRFKRWLLYNAGGWVRPICISYK